MGGGKSNDFSISGPNKLTAIDWDNSYHRTAVVSCLVNGVYTMQRDKAKKRASGLANPWWESFGFSLVECLINEADDSIYGAIFEYNNYDNYQKNTCHLGGIPPRCVIAFRGTILRSKTVVSDLKQGTRCLFSNTLSDGRRFKHAIQAIATVVAKHKSERTCVWLAGHSLGAGIALLAGKEMARAGIPLETYAFNPPHSLPLDWIPYNPLLKGGFRLANCLCKATLGTLASFFHDQTEEDARLAMWAPYLYVNTADDVCSEYISDFKRKKLLAMVGASIIESAIGRFQLRSIFTGGGGGEGTSSLASAEPIQLLSSADITVNKIRKRDSLLLFKGHKLKQWWEPDPAVRENWKFHSVRPYNFWEFWS